MSYFSLVRAGQVRGIYTDLFDAAEMSRPGDEILWSEEWPLDEETEEPVSLPRATPYCRPKARPELLTLNHWWD